MVTFPHANGFQVSDDLFVQAWDHVVSIFGPVSKRSLPLSTPLPRLNAKQSLSDCLEKGYEFSLDYLCRILVPNGFRNTMQASDQFMELNSHILQGETWLQT